MTKQKDYMQERNNNVNWFIKINKTNHSSKDQSRNYLNKNNEQQKTTTLLQKNEASDSETWNLLLYAPLIDAFEVQADNWMCLTWSVADLLPWLKIRDKSQAVAAIKMVRNVKAKKLQMLASNK